MHAFSGKIVSVAVVALLAWGPHIVTACKNNAECAQWSRPFIYCEHCPGLLNIFGDSVVRGLAEMILK
ncbi:hypothetical protein Cob_v010658 [Colletotrichum orbiculare MAFF 240422]|uniref:Uncharacterized protein n=1 Tax=Colletotrichum orbiculare (strain 104-T / ATCC 96160 / CBS 514.97 / LARS 414 / MAFF 240422) TaxID=1213857 RepID=A0A484FHQ4_COLOR|nr:hypothetical protein Cob_v010658 [Colletotrichum orbiculare MAFF 240422]